MFNITSKSILIFLYILCTWILLICYFVSLIIGAFEVAEIDLEVLKYKNKIINLAFWIGYGCVVYSILINVLSSDLTIGLFTILIFLKHNVLLGYTIYNKRFKKIIKNKKTKLQYLYYLVFYNSK